MCIHVYRYEFVYYVCIAGVDVYVYMCVYMYMYLYLYLYMHVYIYIYIYADVYMVMPTYKINVPKEPPQRSLGTAMGPSLAPIARNGPR